MHMREACAGGQVMRQAPQDSRRWGEGSGMSEAGLLAVLSSWCSCQEPHVGSR